MHAQEVHTYILYSRTMINIVPAVQAVLRYKLKYKCTADIQKIRSNVSRVGPSCLSLTKDLCLKR